VRLRLSIVLLLAAVAAAASAIAWAAESQDGGSSPPPSTPPKAAETEPALRASFSVLDKSKNNAPTDRESLRRFADGPHNQYGVNPDLARSASIRGLSTTEVVAPGRGGLCVLDVSSRETHAACGGTREAVAGQVFLVTLCSADLSSGTSRVTGVVPDEVSQVTLTDQDDNAVTQRVADNVFGFEVRGGVKSLAYLRDDGRREVRTVEVGVPPKKCIATAPSSLDDGP
jgi:hypothetical protein